MKAQRAVVLLVGGLLCLAASGCGTVKEVGKSDAVVTRVAMVVQSTRTASASGAIKTATAIAPTGQPGGRATLAPSKSTGGPSAIVGNSTVNVRSGPGTEHSIIGKATPKQKFSIIGRTADSSWWQIDVGGKAGWVAASVVTATGSLEAVPAIADIPTPPSPKPTAPPKPTAAPAALSYTVPLGQEHLTPLWSMKLYDVKRAKAVYLADTAEVAQGTWLIPMIEFRNLGKDTAEPRDHLHFYLQDDKGRTFTFDPLNPGVMGAAWQFQAGHTYDHIKPGALLGVALPFDVSPDFGDAWLRVKEAPNLVMYLGNVSQMPESR